MKYFYSKKKNNKWFNYGEMCIELEKRVIVNQIFLYYVHMNLCMAYMNFQKKNLYVKNSLSQAFRTTFQMP